MDEDINKKLLYERYSVKQMIAYFILGYMSTKDKEEFREILNSIVTKLIRIEKKEILKMINVKYIANVDIYWNLTLEQVLCYSYIIFEKLMKVNQKIKIQDISHEFIVIAKLYSPNNAVEYVNRKLNKNNE